MKPEIVERIPLRDLAGPARDAIVSGPFGSNLKTSDYTDEGVPILRLQNVRTEYLNDNNLVFTSPGKAEELSSHAFAPGDIVVTKLGQPLGQACVVPETFPPGIVSADVVRVRIKDQELRDYVVKAINSPACRRELHSQISGTTRPRVGLNQVRDLTIPLTVPEVREKVVDYLDAQFSRLADAEASLKRAKTNLERYRRSVLHAACTGQLVPTEASLAKAEGRSFEPATVLLERILKERRAKWEEAEVEKARAKGKELRTGWEKRYKEPVAPDTEGLPELPEGWCWASFEQLFAARSDLRLKLPQKQYDAEGTLAVVDQGEKFPAGRTTRADLQHPGGLPVLAFGDHTRRFRLVDFPFVVGADGLKLIDPPPILSASFALQMLAAARLPDKGYSRHFQYLKATNFALPPLAESTRIEAAVDQATTASRACAEQIDRGGQGLVALRQSILQSVFGASND